MAITKVTNSLVSVNAIHGTLIADNAITSVHIAQNQVTAVQIPDGSITATQLGANSVDSSELVDGSIDTSHIADAQITTAKLGTNQVTSAKIAQNSVEARHIADGSITDTQLGSGAFTMGTITTTGAIRGPASLTIDPATVGDNTGTVVIAGNLQVDGTTTTINSTQLSVADKKITVGKGSGSSSAANESGFEVGVGADGASSNPSMLYSSSGTKFVINKPLDITGNVTATRAVLTDGITDTGQAGSATAFNECGTTADFRIESTGNDNMFVVDGGLNRVGIGTYSQAPRILLDIQGSVMPATGDAASVEDMLTLYRNGSASVWSGGATLALGRYSTGNGSAPKSRLDFKLKNATGSNTALPETTVMTLQSNGNVGIGTALPVSKLHVSGNITIDSSSNAPYLDFVENGDTGDSKARIAMDQISGTSGQMLFYTEGSGTLTERMRIASDGQTFFWNEVNISTGSNKKISFTDADDTFRAGIQAVTTGGQMVGSSAANDFALRSQSNMLFSTGGNTERLYIDTNGKIFMNEGVPFSWTDSSHNVSAEIYGDSSDNLVFRNTSSKTERMRINSTGHLTFNPVSGFSGLNNSFLGSSNGYMYAMGGTAGLYLADNSDLHNAIGIRNANYIDFTTGGVSTHKFDTAGIHFQRADGQSITAKESIVMTVDVDNNTASRVFTVNHGNGKTLLNLYDDYRMDVGTIQFIVN